MTVVGVALVAVRRLQGTHTPSWCDQGIHCWRSRWQVVGGSSLFPETPREGQVTMQATLQKRAEQSWQLCAGVRSGPRVCRVFVGKTSSRCLSIAQGLERLGSWTDMAASASVSLSLTV